MIPAWLSEFDAPLVYLYAFATVGLLVTLVPGLMLLMRRVASSPQAGVSFGTGIGLLSTAGLAWFAVIYSLAFGPAFDPSSEQTGAEPPMSMSAMMQSAAEAEGTQHLYARGGWIGNLDFAMFGTLSPQGNTDQPLFSSRPTSSRIPHTVFEAYQFTVFLAAFGSMLVVLAARLSTRAAASASLVWAVLVYAPAVHWLWGEGWLGARGGYDSGGGLLFLILGCSTAAAVICLRQFSTNQLHKSPTSAPVLPPVAMESGLLFAGVTILCCTFSHPTPGVAGVSMFNTLLAICTACTVAGGLALLRDNSAIDDVILRGMVIGLATVAGGSGLYLPASVVVVTLISTTICCGLFHLLSSSARSTPLAFVASCLILPSALGLLGVGVFAHENYSVRHWNGNFVAGLAEGNTQQFQAQLETVAAVGIYCCLATALIVIPTARLCRPNHLSPPSTDSEPAS